MNAPSLRFLIVAFSLLFARGASAQPAPPDDDEPAPSTAETAEEPPFELTGAPGQGVTARFGDTFSLNVRGRIQIRYQLDLADAQDARQAVNVGTARLYFGGNVREFALQLADRPRPVGELTLDRDVGVSIYSERLLDTPVAYRLSAFGGGGTNLSAAKDAGVLLVARLELRPFGAIDDDSEGDLERRTAARRRRRDPLGRRGWRGPRRAHALGPRLHRASVLHVRSAARDRGAPVGHVRAQRHRSSLRHRGRDGGQELAAGLNYYFNGHKLKVQANWIARTDDFDLGTADHVAHVQLDATF